MFNKVNEDLMNALKSGDKFKLSVLLVNTWGKICNVCIILLTPFHLSYLDYTLLKIFCKNIFWKKIKLPESRNIGEFIDWKEANNVTNYQPISVYPLL